MTSDFNIAGFLGSLLGGLTVMVICVGCLMLLPTGFTLIEAWAFYTLAVGVGYQLDQAIKVGMRK